MIQKNLSERIGSIGSTSGHPTVSRGTVFQSAPQKRGNWLKRGLAITLIAGLLTLATACAPVDKPVVCTPFCDSPKVYFTTVGEVRENIDDYVIPAAAAELSSKVIQKDELEEFIKELDDNCYVIGTKGGCKDFFGYFSNPEDLELKSIDQLIKVCPCSKVMSLYKSIVEDPNVDIESICCQTVPKPTPTYIPKPTPTPTCTPTPTPTPTYTPTPTCTPTPTPTPTCTPKPTCTPYHPC